MADADDWSSLAAALAEQFRDSAARHDRDGTFPHAHFDTLRDAGLLTLTTPERHGGVGAGLRDAVGVVRAVARACPSTALVLAMQYLHQHAAGRNPRWPAHVSAAVAHDAVERGGLVNSLRVEPELGTPGRGGLPATVARRSDDGGWLLSGRKIYCTGIPALSWLQVWARTDEPEPRVGSFLVPARAPGIETIETWSHLGLRASASHDVVFHDTPIPADHAVDVRPPADWRGRDPTQASWNVVLISAVYTGVAEAGRDWLRQFLRDRVPSNLGAPLASLPRMQEAMGRIEARLMTNIRLLHSLADQADAGTPMDLIETDLLKVVMADNAIDAVQDAVALCGNHALAQANPLERHLRDVLCARIHTPQADSAYLAAGRSRLA